MIIAFARFIKKAVQIDMVPVLLAIIEKDDIVLRGYQEKNVYYAMAEKEENEGKKCTSPINSLRTRGPAGGYHFHRMKVKLDSAGAVERTSLQRCHRGHAFGCH